MWHSATPTLPQVGGRQAAGLKCWRGAALHIAVTAMLQTLTLHGTIFI